MSDETGTPEVGPPDPNVGKTSEPNEPPVSRSQERAAPPPEYVGYDRGPDGQIPLQSGVQYPRYMTRAYGPIPPGPPTVRFAAIGEAWDLIRAEMGTFVLAMLVYCIFGWFVFQIAYAVTSPISFLNPTMDPMEMLLNPTLWLMSSAAGFIGQAFLFVLGGGYLSLCMKRLRGEPTSVANLFDGFKYIGPLFIAGVVTSILLNFATIFFVIPAIFAAGAFAFVPQIIIDQKTGPFEAIRLSFIAVKKDMFMMGLLCLVTATMAYLGCCGCIVIIFTAPIYYMVLAMHYHAYFPPQGTPEQFGAMQVAPQYTV